MSSPWISRAIASGVILTAVTIRSQAQSPDPGGHRTALRSGSHGDFGRVVIDTSSQTAYRLEQNGDHVILHLSDDITLDSPPALPRNVISMTTNGSTVDLVLKHGAKLHPGRIDGHVVLDIRDAPVEAAPVANPRAGEIHRQPQRNAPLAMATSSELGGRAVAGPVAVKGGDTAEHTPVATQPLLPADSTSPPSAPVRPTPGQSVPAPNASEPIVNDAAQQTPLGRDVLPGNEGATVLPARRVKLPKEMDGSAFLVPFDSAAGAASFRSGDSIYVVFDERRPVDMSALRDDHAFADASVQLLPNGTLIRIPIPATRTIVLTQMPQGWRIAELTVAPKQQPITLSFADGRLNMAAEQPSDVVSLADPETGATLLVGTQHRPGQGLTVSRRSTEFVLHPAIQGVVVEPLSDAINLKEIPTGFSLTGGPEGLLLSPPTTATEGMMDGALRTRRLDFSTLPTDALMRREIRQIDDASAAQPMARGVKNHAASESLASLGLAAEAQGLLNMSAEQDPKEAASPDAAALRAIAALLAGRPEEATALADPRLDGTDEISLWRAIRQAMDDDSSPSAAAVFAATAPLVFLYPAAIRDHVLPLIVETMIKGGEIAPAARMLAERKDDPKLAYARALMAQTDGNTEQALAMLDALANGRDQNDRARAATRAVEIRLATNKLDKAQAADALDKLLYAWRGDGRELALRERVAELRGQSGSWRAALATLRTAEADFPEQGAAIHERMKDTFAAMMRAHGEELMPPLDFVSTIDENADLVLASGVDDAVQQALADRLLTLDLPDRAKPVLQKLMQTANSDLAKARFGAGLATMESREGHDANALAILKGSDGVDLPPDLVEQRTILRAEAVARQGDSATATGMLTPLHTERAIEARAQILESASDWAGAEQAWTESLALTLPESGMLDDTQTRTVLRLTTATARAGDDPGLEALRTKYGSRIGASPLGDMFRLLTVEPVRNTSDIVRSQQEMNLATSLPADLKALQGGKGAR